MKDETAAVLVGIDGSIQKQWDRIMSWRWGITDVASLLKQSSASKGIENEATWYETYDTQDHAETEILSMQNDTEGV